MSNPLAKWKWSPSDWFHADVPTKERVRLSDKHNAAIDAAVAEERQRTCVELASLRGAFAQAEQRIQELEHLYFAVSVPERTQLRQRIKELEKAFLEAHKIKAEDTPAC